MQKRKSRATKTKLEQPKSRAVIMAEEMVMTKADSVATRDEAVSLSCGKPPKGQFFRVHPTMHVDVRILKRKVGMKEEPYLVLKSVAGKLDYVTPHTVFLCVTLDGVPFLWLISTGDDGYSTSGRKIAADGMEVWLRLVSNTKAGNYHKRVLTKEKQAPDFQGLDKKEFVELLSMAFGEDHIISNTDHPIAQLCLSGE